MPAPCSQHRPRKKLNSMWVVRRYGISLALRTFAALSCLRTLVLIFPSFAPAELRHA